MRAVFFFGRETTPKFPALRLNRYESSLSLQSAPRPSSPACARLSFLVYVYVIFTPVKPAKFCTPDPDTFLGTVDDSPVCEQFGSRWRGDPARFVHRKTRTMVNSRGRRRCWQRCLAESCWCLAECRQTNEKKIPVGLWERILSTFGDWRN